MRRVFLILTVFSGLLCAGLLIAVFCTWIIGSDIPLAGQGHFGGSEPAAGLSPRGLWVTFQTSTDANWRLNHRKLGFWADTWPANASLRDLQIICFPYWFLITITAIAPAIYTRRLRRSILIAQYRRRHGFCVTCGYDLRESKERCPECGTAISARS